MKRVIINVVLGSSPFFFLECCVARLIWAWGNCQVLEEAVTKKKKKTKTNRRRERKKKDSARGTEWVKILCLLQPASKEGVCGGRRPQSYSHTSTPTRRQNSTKRKKKSDSSKESLRATKEAGKKNVREQWKKKKSGIEVLDLRWKE